MDSVIPRQLGVIIEHRLDPHLEIGWWLRWLFFIEFGLQLLELSMQFLAEFEPDPSLAQGLVIRNDLVDAGLIQLGFEKVDKIFRSESIEFDTFLQQEFDFVFFRPVLAQLFGTLIIRRFFASI